MSQKQITPLLYYKVYTFDTWCFTKIIQLLLEPFEQLPNYETSSSTGFCDCPKKHGEHSRASCKRFIRRAQYHSQKKQVGCHAQDTEGVDMITWSIWNQATFIRVVVKNLAKLHFGLQIDRTIILLHK